MILILNHLWLFMAIRGIHLFYYAIYNCFERFRFNLDFIRMKKSYHSENNFPDYLPSYIYTWRLSRGEMFYSLQNNIFW